MMETDQEALCSLQEDMAALDIGNRLVLENRHTGTVETVTIKGDDAGLEEASMALKKGAMVSEMNVRYQSGDQKWKFTIKGESLHVSTLKIPETGPMEKEEDWEGAVLERIFLHEKAIVLVQCLYRCFIGLRIQNEWSSRIIPQIKKWISGPRDRKENG
jgi:hypothetical protein